MIRRTALTVAIATIAIIVSAFAVCISSYNNGLDRNDLLLYSSVLASILSLTVLIVACLVVSEPESSSEAYRRKYRPECGSSDDGETKNS
jgi:O-antigen/teichoic acid export membrane protein